MEKLIIFSTLLLNLVFKTYSSQYIDSLLIEEPYYGPTLGIATCINKFTIEKEKLKCDSLKIINQVDFFYEEPDKYA